jgi:tetratricopeptide (TPR) repeat protein
MMYLKHTILIIVATSILACAGGQLPRQMPKDLRKSARYMNKGVLLYTWGCYPRALKFFNDSYERYTVADNLQGVANSLLSIANIYLQLEDVESALLVYKEAIETYRIIGDDEGRSRACANYAVALIRADRLDKAADALNRADDLAGTEPGLMALRAKNRALLLIAQGQEDEAEKLLERTLENAAGGEPETVAGLYFTLGQLLLNHEHPNRAEPHLQKALDLDRAAGAYYGIARDLAALGTCYTRLDRLSEAISFQKRSAKIFILIQQPKKAQAVINALEANAEHAQADIQATLHWINQWLEGRVEANICR